MKENKFRENSEEKIEIYMQDVKLKFIIDSGSQCNIIDYKTFKYCINSNVKVQLKRTSREIYALGSYKPLKLIGKLEAVIKLENGKKSNLLFYVTRKNTMNILGKHAAMKLGILKIGILQDEKSVKSREQERATKMTRNFRGHKYAHVEVTSSAKKSNNRLYVRRITDAAMSKGTSTEKLHNWKSSESNRATGELKQPFENIAIEILQPTEEGFVIFMFDYYSRYYEVVCTKRISAARTIEVLEEMFTRHGTPSIMSLKLNQSQLSNSVFIDFCKKNKINLQLETTGYEQAENDLQIQKNNIIKIIKDAKRENRVYKATLREYLLAYRKEINSTAGVNLQRKIKFKRELQQRLCQLQVIDQIKLKFKF
jgi:hypothetical protein